MAYDSLEKLKDSLAEYDAADLVRSAAALQLIPPNSDHLIRIQALAHTAVSLLTNPVGQKKISTGSLIGVCHQPPLGSGPIAMAEDPYENRFTEPVFFNGGLYTVLPGNAHLPTFTLQHLLKGIFLRRPPLQSREYNQKVYQVIRAVLIISQEICERAGLGHKEAPIASKNGKLHVPGRASMDTLKAAVNFPSQELEALLVEANIPLDVLDPLLADPSAINLAQYDFQNPILSSAPLVKVGDDYLVAMPGMLVTAVRHYAVVLAKQMGLQEDVSKRFTESVWDTVDESLGQVGLKDAGIHLADTKLPTVKDDIFGFDVDKIAHVILVTDPLDDYKETEPFGHWEDGKIAKAVDNRITEINGFLRKSSPSPKVIFTIVIIQTVGRSFLLKLKQRKGDDPFLMLSASDLETLCLSQGGEDLGLYYFALAQDRFRKGTHVISFSVLDEFRLYQKKGQGFYLSDERKPDFISVTGDLGGALRNEVAEKYDIHPIPSHNNFNSIEVIALHGEGLPIYVPRHLSYLKQNIVIAVEGLAAIIWIVVPEIDGNTESDERSHAIEMCDAVAYWLWQLTPSLKKAFDSWPDYDDVLRINVHIKDWSKWQEQTQEPDDSPIVIGMDGPHDLDLTLSPACSILFAGRDNEGERELVKKMLEGLSLLPYLDSAELSDERIQEMVEKHAPLGLKKKLLVLNTNSSPLYDPRDLPESRKVQRAVTNFILDDLGDSLKKQQGTVVGSIPDADATHIINEAVVYCYEQLEAKIALLSPDGLLERLMKYYEANIRETQLQKLMIPTRIACYSTEEEIVERLRDEMPQLAETSQALRFLIEYVTARPPEGVVKLSISDFDELMVLSSQIIGWGMESDLIINKLVPANVSFLPSERLGVDREAYTSAIDAFMPRHLSGEVEIATRSFAGKVEIPTEVQETPALSQALETAAIAEFGFSFTELADFVGKVIEIGHETSHGVTVSPMVELIKRLAKELGWTEQKVDSILSLLSLEERPDFMIPPQPLKKQEVYPWRYNRALSYMRKPFILRKEMILWGGRHLYIFVGHLHSLCLSGRLKASTPEMQRFIGDVNTAKGKEFNNLVKELVEKVNPSLLVRPAYKEGALRPLGDIDVLVVNVATKKIYAIECKNFVQARMPHEMGSQVQDLFVTVGTKLSYVDKHKRRIAWLMGNVPLVLKDLNIPSDGKWMVEGFMVTSEELFTPYLKDSGLAIISYRDFRDNLVSRL